MIGKNLEIYNGEEEECNIKINLFTNGTSYVLDIYAKIMQNYHQIMLSDGGDIAAPKQKSWW